MPNIINVCPGCGGELVPFSVDREERIRRRIGQAMMVRCRRCGVETSVNKQAWRLFVSKSRGKGHGHGARVRAKIQPTLFS